VTPTASKADAARLRRSGDPCRTQPEIQV